MKRSDGNSTHTHTQSHTPTPHLIRRAGSRPGHWSRTSDHSAWFGRSLLINNKYKTDLDTTLPQQFVSGFSTESVPPQV